MIITFVYKDIYLSFYSFERGWRFSWVWETETDEDRDRLLYWSINSFSLDYTTLCNLQDRTALLLLLGRGYSPGGPSVMVSWLSLRPSLTSKHLRVLFHNVYNFRLDPMIFFRLFTQVRLWLTARSRVNIQNEVTFFFRPLRMDIRVLADPQEFVDYISFVRTQDIVWKTCEKRWMIGTEGESVSGKSVQLVWLINEQDS